MSRTQRGAETASPMFVLRCPSCRYEARVRFARMGATAACPKCRKAYRVEPRTIRVEQDDPQRDVGDGEPVVMTSAPTQMSGASGGEGGGEDVIATAPPDQGLGSAGTIDRRRAQLRRFVRERRNSRLVLAGVLVLTAVGLLITLPIVLDRETPPNAAAGSSASDPATKRSGGGRTPSGSAGSAGGDQTEAGSSVGGAPEADASDRSAVSELRQVVQPEADWGTLDPTRSPFQPAALLVEGRWESRLIRDGPGGQALVLGELSYQDQRVYRSGLLRVQLLDQQGRAFAELRKMVPVIRPGGGVQLRAVVPAPHASRASDLVAEFTPVEPMADALPLRADDAAARIAEDPSGERLVEVELVNPNGRPVEAARLAIELLTEEGWPLGQWSGTLERRVDANGKTRVRLRVPPDLPGEARRVQVRAYGHPEAEPAARPSSAAPPEARGSRP